MRRGFLSALACIVFVAGVARAEPDTAGDARSRGTRQPVIVAIATEDASRPWLAQLSQGFREAVLEAPEQPSVFFEPLDFVRFGEPAYAEGLRRWLREKYHQKHVDLVVALGEPALEFLTSGPDTPWPTATAMYLESGYISMQPPRGSTGILLEETFGPALEVVKRILPRTRKVALVTGASRIEQERFATYGDRVRRAGLEPIMLSGLSLDGLTRSVAGLPHDSVVFVLVPVVDGTNRVFSPDRPCNAIAEATSVPIFTLGYHDLGCGVVGGLMRNWNVVGRLVGAKALERLHAPLPAAIHWPIASFGVVEFDERQLTRWNIPEDRLPAGSVVRFRAPSLWRDYRRESFAGATLLLIQALLIAGLAVESYRRHRAEIQSRRHLVAMSHLDRRAALGELTAALAHELHQPLAAILRNADAAALQLASGKLPEDELRDIIEDIRRDDKRAAAIIRRLRAFLERHELETAPVDLHDVVAETVAIAAHDAAARGVNVSLNLAARRRTVLGDKVHLQQVLLNLLLNGIDAAAAMRADRRRLTVQSVSDEDGVEVRVIDAGPGLPPEVASHMFDPFFSTKQHGSGHGLGLGLSVARSIAEAHGGSVLARNNDDQGATVWFRLPLPPMEGT